MTDESKPRYEIECLDINDIQVSRCACTNLEEVRECLCDIGYDSCAVYHLRLGSVSFVGDYDTVFGFVTRRYYRERLED